VIVHRGARGIDARQTSDNLLLSDQAEIDTKPELEIYSDDVKCSHGSTVGELDAEHLFYLRTRGVDEEHAREILTTAFATTVLERIAAPDIRASIADRVTARLRTLAEVSR
jgi:Fe-S cluster assembly protein SufD